LRSINSRPIQLQQLATSTFHRNQRLRIRNDAACISSSSLSNSAHDDMSDISNVGNTCDIDLVGDQRNNTNFISAFSSSQRLRLQRSFSSASKSASAQH